MATIEYLGQLHSSAPGETLLDALLRQGADVVFSCRKGSCHCCAVRLVEGDIEAVDERDASIGDGHVLCCMARPRGHVVLAPPRADQRAMPVELLQRTALGADVFALDLAPHRTFSFRPGQHVHLIRADGLTRAYSMVDQSADGYTFRIHVRSRHADGMSGWLCRQAEPGQQLHLRGPSGDCCYDEDMRQRTLLMLATGSGAGMLLGLAQDALARGHSGMIHFHHGARDRQGLYLHDALLELQAEYLNFRYSACISDHAAEEIRHGKITGLAFSIPVDANDCEVFLCGSPRMVEQARVCAVAAGIRRERIHADSFTPAHPLAPRDAETIAGIPPDPELWAALESGPALTRILQAFYERVYQDPQLAPFFQQVSMQRVIYKQYEFLADLFTGRRAYLGLNPFNAHHWMVISDELFDHRERLFEHVLREHGLAPALIRRWMAVHERFRSDMVKPTPRGIVSDGVEQPLRVHSLEQLDIDAVCDGCSAEIPAGAPSRYQHRIGHLHCAECAVL